MLSFWKDVQFLVEVFQANCTETSDLSASRPRNLSQGLQAKTDLMSVSDLLLSFLSFASTFLFLPSLVKAMISSV